MASGKGSVGVIRNGQFWIVGLCILSGQTWAQQSNVVITLQPVAPQGNPPSQYPPGTTIVGQEIILGSVPARVWLEIYVTGWGPDVLRTVQVAISATDPENDGGGYGGASATCMDGPSNGAGDLGPAMQACRTNADCRILSGPLCPQQKPNHCFNGDGTNFLPFFPAGKFCEPGFENTCHPNWIGRDIDVFVGYDAYTTLNFRYGMTVDPGLVPTDFHPSYLGTLVLDVPATAKGTYTIDFDETHTFLLNDQGPGNNNIPISAFVPARITIPCGRCCSGYASGQIQCVDHVGFAECPDSNDQMFTDGELCPESEGSPCPPCQCDDGLFCNGKETCDPLQGCIPGEPPCEANLCDEVTGCHTPIPAVSDWGLALLALLFLIVGKLRFGRASSTAK